MRKRVAFVTGTRAEFGLMEATLRELSRRPELDFRLIVTGMHLSREHGRSIDAVRRRGWTVDATLPWSGDPARATGRAIAGLTTAYDRVGADVVLVVGDRVEAFAAATAAHLSGRVVAHVHGGDRAEGQYDDSLRHAVTKLSHVHLAATRASAQRVLRLGEDPWRVHVTGTPGLADVRSLERLPDVSEFSPFALVLLHPDDPDERWQRQRADQLVRAVRRSGFDGGHVIYPNNDPGWLGIDKAWRGLRPQHWRVHRDLPRPQFLWLLRHAAVLAGNSSSGIIEAASLGTPVVNVGDRQRGRERSRNVNDVDWHDGRLTAALASVWNKGRPKRFTGRNVYGTGDAAGRIAAVLADLRLDAALRRKLIAY